MCHYISAQEPIGLFVYVGVYVPCFSFYIPCTTRYYNRLLWSRWNSSCSTLHNCELRGLMCNSLFGKSSNWLRRDNNQIISGFLRYMTKRLKYSFVKWEDCCRIFCLQSSYPTSVRCPVYVGPSILIIVSTRRQDFDSVHLLIKFANIDYCFLILWTL